MSIGIVILEQWQKNENLIDKLLEQGVITKVYNDFVLYLTNPRTYAYEVASDFFPYTPPGSYLPTAVVIDNKLVERTRVIKIEELQEAQKSFDLIKERKALLEKESQQMYKDNLKLQRQVTELQVKKENIKSDIEIIQEFLSKMDSNKKDYINEQLTTLTDIANNLKINATGQEASEFFSAIEKLKEIINK